MLLTTAVSFPFAAPKTASAVAMDVPPFFVSLDVVVGDETGFGGQIVFEIHPEWAPLAAERFRELVSIGFYDDARFYRTIPNYIAQFGISSNPELNKQWLCTTCKRLPDEPRLVSNKKGTLSFASGGKNTRQTQVFINLADNGGLPNFLDGMGFTPFGRVVKGMDLVEKLYAGYGLAEAASGGLAGSVSQSKAAYYGNEYLKAVFPKLSYITKAAVQP